MYIALALTLAGIAIGRLFNGHINEKLLGKLIFYAILLLLFLLGGQIGCNDGLFGNLPRLGGQSLCLMLFCVTGSIAVMRLIDFFLSKRGVSSKNAR